MSDNVRTIENARTRAICGELVTLSLACLAPYASVKLQGARGNSLALEIAGYEFPETSRDSLQWLVIRLDAEVGGRRWTCEDPFLQTEDVDRLATWLELAAEGFAKHSIAFLEPELELDASPEADGLIRLRAWLEFAARPPWAKAESREHDFAIELLVTRPDLMAAAGA
ncbi:MAG TPA: hypothetical protein VLK24_06315 [Gaiellaceae bacterium]|nr:hypothetical protein [Gaiellaceae bacterium]